MEKFSTAQLSGAPPGYVGYDEGGTQLARALIAGEVGEDTTVTFHVAGDQRVLEGSPVQVQAHRFRR